MHGGGPDLDALREELAAAARFEQLTTRALAVVAIIQAAAVPLGVRPVIVGGIAVLIWTGDDLFTTGDIDLVMDVPDELGATLDRLGFVRAEDRRHWHLPDAEVYVEAVASDLDRDARTVDVLVHPRRTVSVLSAVDVLLERLDELMGAAHPLVGEQVIALLGTLDSGESEELVMRAGERRLGRLLSDMRRVTEELASGSRGPLASYEFHQIAGAARKAEYGF